MSVPKDIEDLRGHLYARAECFWWATFWIAVGTQALALLAIWVNRTIILAIAALIALLAPILIVWLRERATIVSLRADRCRRLILYADGLGRSISKEELAEVRAWGMRETLVITSFVPPYYASPKPVGPNRLADIVAESSFFTSQLAQKVLSAIWGAFIISGGILISILFLSDLLTPTNESGVAGAIEKIAKSVASSIVFLISGDFLLLIKKYNDLHSTRAVCMTPSNCYRRENAAGFKIH